MNLTYGVVWLKNLFAGTAFFCMFLAGVGIIVGFWDFVYAALGATAIFTWWSR